MCVCPVCRDAHDATKRKYFLSRKEHFAKLARERDHGSADAAEESEASD